MNIKRLFTAGLLIAALALSICAQQPAVTNPPVKAVRQSYSLIDPPHQRFRFDIGDVAYWAGGGADLATSAGKQEAGLFKGHDGRFALGPNLGFKVGLYGAIKAIEAAYPDRPKATMWAKILVGAGWVAIAFGHNRGIPRRQ